jgi:O-antigen/teichoic acid export membrane protein
VSEDNVNGGGWTGPDGATRHLFGRGSLYTIALATQLSAAILVLPLITRLLSPVEFGTAATSIVVIQLGVVVAAAGIPAAITRFFFTAGGAQEARALILGTAVTALVIAVIAELTGPVWSNVFSELTYGTPLRIAVWTMVPFAVVQACQALLRAQDRPAAFVVVAGTAALGGQLTGLVAVWQFTGGAAGYLGGIGAGYAVAAVLGMTFTAPSGRGLRDLSLLKRAFVYGLPTVTHSLALYVLNAGDRVVVERLLGLREVGRYHIAYLIGSLGILLLGALNNAWAPIIYGAPSEHRWRVLRETTGAVYRSGAVVAGGLAIAAPIALRLFAPPGYDPLALSQVVAVTALSVLPYIGYLSAAHILFHEGKTGVFAWITPVVAGVNVGLNFALVPHLGLIGASLATVVSYGLLAIGIRAAARRVVRVDWPTRSIVLAVGLALFLAGAGALLPYSELGLWIRGGIGGLLVLVLVMTIRTSMKQPAGGLQP